MSYNKYIATISKNIKALLHEYSMSIMQLSKQSGVSYTPTYSATCGTSNPNFETLFKISRVFNITVSQLVGDHPLNLKNSTYYTKTVHLLDWNIQSFISENASIIKQVTITCSKELSTQAFALKAKNDGYFFQNTILIFDKINDNIKRYVDNIILVSFDSVTPVLNKLNFDGQTFFLQSLTHNTPPRKMPPTDKILAHLVQSVTVHD